jgi:hypothetical protein
MEAPPQAQFNAGSAVATIRSSKAQSMRNSHAWSLRDPLSPLTSVLSLSGLHVLELSVIAHALHRESHLNTTTLAAACFH